MERLQHTRWLVLILAVVFGISTAAGLGAQERRILSFPDADYAGNDYRTVKDTTLDACQASCLADQSCQAFTFNSNANWCFLKNGVGTLSVVQGAVAGRVVAGLSVRSVAPALDLSFLPESLGREALRYKSELQKPDNITVAEALAAAHDGQRSGDPRRAAKALRQALALDPNNADAWNFLAGMLLDIRPQNYTQRYRLPEEASAAALNALTLPGNTDIQLAGLASLAQALQRRQLWRPALQTLKASLALQDTPERRAAYDKLRATRGFRMLDYSVDADAAAPRLCVQFSEKFKNAGKGIEDYVLLNGARPPAVTVEASQICVDGLKHGQRYQLTLRSGLPSDVGETIDKPIELTAYVRDRSPAVRFTGNNYVLPRVGAKGIPVVTINTDLVKIEISKIGERGLAAARRGNNFLANLTGYQAENIARESGTQVWKGEMPIAPKLNREVVTAFPIDQVLKSPEPGIYVMIARIRNGENRDWDTQATQWFVVSDLGLVALNARDGVHVFVRSLASAAPVAGVKLRLVAVNNEILGTAETDAKGYVRFAAGLARGTGGMAPALLLADAGDDFALLEVDKPGFDLTDRGVDGRAPAGPVDIFAFTERGVYRPGATVRLVALARDAEANAAKVPLTFIVRRPDGVEYSRQTSRGDGLGGHQYDIALDKSVLTGTWRVAAYTDPKQAPLTELKFLVEDFIPERIDFTLASQAANVSASAPASISLTGRYLYGPPAAGLRLEGEVIVRPAKSAPSGFSGYTFGLADEELPALRRPLDELSATGTDGTATLVAGLPPLPETTLLLEAEFVVRMRESGGRAVERTLVLPVASGTTAIGIKPLFDENGPGEGQEARFNVRVMGTDGADASMKGAAWELLRVERRYQWYRLDGRWNFEPTTRTSRVANGTVDITAGTPASIAAAVKWGRYRLEVTGPGPDSPVSALSFSAGWYGADATSETPDV
ncbi:MAG: MG2 domain-containing protein, partial [Hyphomicrobiales bacterium]